MQNLLGTTPAVRIAYRASGYGLEHERQLYEAFRDLGPVRTRALRLPEAGASTDIWFVFEFFGATLASGVLYDIVKLCVAKLAPWARGRANRHQIDPDISEVRIGLDDVTVEFTLTEISDDVNFLTVSAIEKLPELASIVSERFRVEMIAKHEVQYLRVPVFAVDEDGRASSAPSRRWIVGKGAPFPTHYYDPEKHLFTAIPYDAHVATRSPPGDSALIP